MSDQKFYASYRLSWFDRILFLLIMVSHFCALFEYTRDKIEKAWTPEYALMVYVILVTLMWSIFMFSFSYRQVKDTNNENKYLKEQNNILQRSEGYVLAYPSFSLAFSFVHQMQRDFSEIPIGAPINEDKLATVINQFEDICLHVANAFKTITGKQEMSVCIKLVNGKELSNSSSVRTFVRDSINVERNYEENGQTHMIEKNSSFSHVIKQIGKGKGMGSNGRHFFCNDLPQKVDYKSSSFLIYNQPVYTLNMTKQQRDEQWRLPYKSAIVVGIYPNQKKYYKEKYIIGFICIDSPYKNIFDEVRDPAILTGLADGIYNSLKTFDLLTR